MDPASSPGDSSTPPREVVKLVSARFAPEDVLKYRVICKAWEEVVGEGSSVDKLIFTVGANERSIHAFDTLSSLLKLKHFLFTNVDLNGSELFGSPEIFRNFMMNHCPRIVSLELANCRLFTGRFFELVSNCPSLRSLEVRACPSIYQVSMGILHSRICWNSLKRNLAGMTTLKLEETCIREKDLFGLSCEMKCLKSAHFACKNGYILPRLAILNLMKNNCGTLEELALTGRFFGAVISSEVGEAIHNLPVLTALKSLSFLGCQFQFQETLLMKSMCKKCPKLVRFAISKTTLQWGNFSGLVESIRELEIGECTLTRNAFEDMKFSRNLRKLKVTPDTEDFTKDMEEIVSSFLANGMKPNLETLQLQLVMGGQIYLKALEPGNFPKLTSLTLAGFSEAAGDPLRQVFKNFPNLQSFSLTDSEEIVDVNLCPRDKEVEESLGNLKNLRTLNLSRTAVGNGTLLDCVTLMKNLKYLRLDETKVTKAAVAALFMKFRDTSEYPSFRFISITGCTDCRFTVDEINVLKQMVPRVDVACPINVSHLDLVSAT